MFDSALSGLGMWRIPWQIRCIVRSRNVCMPVINKVGISAQDAEALSPASCCRTRGKYINKEYTMTTPFPLIAFSSLLLLTIFTATVASAAYEDPSERVARFSHAQGGVSYSPAGEEEWFDAIRNRPLIWGDRLWTDRDARAEFQVGSVAVRLGSNTGVEILNLDDHIAQVMMTQGTLNLSVRRMYPGQTFEIATPTLAFTVNRPGRYRIDVDRRNAVTTIELARVQ